jgi:hypothetical protein
MRSGKPRATETTISLPQNATERILAPPSPCIQVSGLPYLDLEMALFCLTFGRSKPCEIRHSAPYVDLNIRIPVNTHPYCPVFSRITDAIISRHPGIPCPCPRSHPDTVVSFIARTPRLLPWFPLSRLPCSPGHRFLCIQGSAAEARHSTMLPGFLVYMSPPCPRSPPRSKPPTTSMRPFRRALTAPLFPYSPVYLFPCLPVCLSNPCLPVPPSTCLHVSCYLT